MYIMNELILNSLTFLPGFPSPGGPGSPLSPGGPCTATPSPTAGLVEEQLVQASPWEHTTHPNHDPGTFWMITA